jgi:hypothetical protein
MVRETKIDSVHGHLIFARAASNIQVAMHPRSARRCPSSGSTDVHRRS